jgi:hypothetical protein
MQKEVLAWWERRLLSLQAIVKQTALEELKDAR